jgi:hypothetical protein
MTEQTKVCMQCGEEKPLLAFPQNKSREDGYHYYCRVCHNANNVQYRIDRRLRALEGIKPKKHRKKYTYKNGPPVYIAGEE